MTDRGRDALALTRDMLRIGPSRMLWRDGRLVVEIDELAWPHMHRLRGRVTLTPSAVTGVELPLTPDGGHVWRPFAPVADVAVTLDRPGWQWRGHGYFDANFGLRALEDDFRFWTWGRFPTRAGAMCFYDAVRRDGSRLGAAIAFGRDGHAAEVAPPPVAPLSRSLWAVRRETRADPGARPRQVRAMLDAPFYCRSQVETMIGGERSTGVHEALDLDRFASPWLKPMLAVKVPRRRSWP